MENLGFSPDNMSLVTTNESFNPEPRINENSPIPYLSMNYFVNYCIFLPFISLVGEGHALQFEFLNIKKKLSRYFLYFSRHFRQLDVSGRSQLLREIHGVHVRVHAAAFSHRSHIPHLHSTGYNNFVRLQNTVSLQVQCYKVCV